MDETVIQGKFTEKILGGIVEQGYLSEQALEEALDISRQRMKPIEEVLIDEGFISKDKLANFIEKYFELPQVDLSSYVPDPEALKFIPKKIVHKYLILPLFEIEGVLTVAVHNPISLFKLDEVSRQIEMDLDPVLATESSIIDAIVIYYGVSPDEVESFSPEASLEVSEKEFTEEDILRIDLDRLAIIEGEAVNQLLTEIMLKAKKANASAVHIEPIMGDFRVIFRIGSELVVVGQAARSLQKPLLEQLSYIARIKRNAPLPQERIVEIQRVGEVLISIYPSIYGERVTITFFKEAEEFEKLEDFGFTPEESQRIINELSSMHGLVLIGAPVSSGKTSLLRAMLKTIVANNKFGFLIGPEEIKPVEGVQFQKLRGEELVSAIEGIAYQDLDVVGIDELDSVESYKAAVRLAKKTLTITTMEASHVTDAISRLLKSGAEPFSLSWNLRMVVSLRLLKRNCPKCIEEYKSPLLSHKAVKKFLGDNPTVKRSTGCDNCNNTAYRGFVAVPEILFVKESIAQRIAVNFNEESFYNFIRNKACPTPLKKGFELVAQGLVSLEELYKKTGFKE